MSEAFDLFDVFWGEFPRRVAKKAARKAWDKIKPDEALAHEIIAAVQKQCKTVWLEKELEYIPHPRTWLCQERWEDEIPEDYGQRRSRPLRETRETDHEKNQRAAREYLTRSMAPTVRGDLPDVREDPSGLPRKV